MLHIYMTQPFGWKEKIEEIKTRDFCLWLKDEASQPAWLTARLPGGEKLVSLSLTRAAPPLKGSEVTDTSLLPATPISSATGARGETRRSITTSTSPFRPLVSLLTPSHSAPPLLFLSVTLNFSSFLSLLTVADFSLSPQSIFSPPRLSTIRFTAASLESGVTGETRGERRSMSLRLRGVLWLSTQDTIGQTTALPEAAAGPTDAAGVFCGIFSTTALLHHGGKLERFLPPLTRYQSQMYPETH